MENKENNILNTKPTVINVISEPASTKIIGTSHPLVVEDKSKSKKLDSKVIVKLKIAFNYVKSHKLNFLRGVILFCILIAAIVIVLVADMSFTELSQKIKAIDFNYLLLSSFLLFDIFLFFQLKTLLTGILNFNNKSFPKNKYLKMQFYAFLALFLGMLILSVSYIFKHPVIQNKYPVDNGHLVSFDEKVEVKFNVPVRTSKLKPTITPKVEGTWEWEPYLGIEGLTRSGTFTFEETLMPDQRIVAYITGITKITDSKENEYDISFWSIKDPILIKSYPADQTTDVARDSKILIQLDTPTVSNYEWKVESDPLFDFTIVTDEKKNVQIVPSQFFPQSADYKIKISKRAITKNLNTNETLSYGDFMEFYSFSFQTVKEPSMESFTPSGSGVPSNAEIKGVFITPVKKESVESKFSVTPAIDGELIWTDERTFQFVPKEELPKQTAFTITIQKGVETMNGGLLENALVFQFETIGEVKVIDQSIGTGTSGASEYSEFVIAFNQEVDQESAQNAFSISPYVPGSFRWAGNNMAFVPSQALALGTTYTVRLAAGIKSNAGGVSSINQYETYFTTRYNITFLDIPQYYQQNKFTCNINAALIGLAWKGYYSNEQALINEIGYNDKRENDQWVGNPYYEFVGTSNGSWGYGAYWPAIQKVFANRGIGTAGYSNFSIVQLAKEVEAGHPVIIWRYNGVGGGQNISWTASDGTYIYAFSGQHSGVVNGFIGTSDNPTSIHFNDPWLGPMWLDVNTFDYYWNFSGRMALVIY